MMSCVTLVGRPRGPDRSVADGPVTFAEELCMALVTSVCTFRHSTHAAHPLTAATLALLLEEQSDTRLDASDANSLELRFAFALQRPAFQSVPSSRSSRTAAPPLPHELALMSPIP